MSGLKYVVTLTNVFACLANIVIWLCFNMYSYSIV